MQWGGGGKSYTNEYSIAQEWVFLFNYPEIVKNLITQVFQGISPLGNSLEAVSIELESDQ